VRKKCSKEIVWMRKNSKNIWEWKWKEVWKRVAETASFFYLYGCVKGERIVLQLYDCVHMHSNS
jgi:long-subunit acyl-CoA synthetase (AMP-forming)